MWDAKKNNPTLSNPNLNARISNHILSSMYSNPYNAGRNQNLEYGNLLHNQMQMQSQSQII